jgi:hypothetical protein
MRVSAVLSKSSIALLGLTILLSGRPAAQSNGSPERFTAVAVNMGTPGRAATKITANKDSHTIVLENYATQPVMLNDVRREKAS